MVDVARQLGRIGNNRGTISETRVEALCLGIGSEGWPEWLYSGRKATPEEDSKKKDFVFSSDVGDLFVQVKSSQRAAEKFRRTTPYRRGMIEVMVVRSTNSQEGLQQRLILKLTNLRDKILERRGER